MSGFIHTYWNIKVKSNIRRYTRYFHVNSHTARAGNSFASLWNSLPGRRSPRSWHRFPPLVNTAYWNAKAVDGIQEMFTALPRTALQPPNTKLHIQATKTRVAQLVQWLAYGPQKDRIKFQLPARTELFLCCTTFTVVKHSWLKTKQSFPSSFEVKNQWSCTSLPHHTS
jgi:hypothetical protein